MICDLKKNDLPVCYLSSVNWIFKLGERNWKYLYQMDACLFIVVCMFYLVNKLRGHLNTSLHLCLQFPFVTFGLDV